jgi:thiol-disulfide isomerase/thioredoxin
MAARTLVSGSLVMALVLGLLALNLVWTLRDCDSLRPVSAGHAAPELSLPTLEGNRVALTQYRGRVVLVSFWASWCGPCLREMPFLERLKLELGPRGLSVLAVNVENSAEKVRQLLSGGRGRGLTLLLDDSGAAVRYGVQTLPHVVLVDHEGRVTHVQVGGGGEEALERGVRLALGRPGVSAPPAGRPGGSPQDRSLPSQ